MRVIALVSGGKDSLHALWECVVLGGHEAVAVAHIASPEKEECDSMMYQTVGWRAVALLAGALRLPLVQEPIGDVGAEDASLLGDVACAGAESATLERVLARAIALFPADRAPHAVCSGAIRSTYQRARVERVAARLGLVALAPLWAREQSALLDEMLAAGLRAVLVKVASIGLAPLRDLGRSLAEMRSRLHMLHDRFGTNVCGEGGEYESLTLASPLFAAHLVIDDAVVVTDRPVDTDQMDDDMLAPVGHLLLRDFRLVVDRDPPARPSYTPLEEPPFDPATPPPSLLLRPPGVTLLPPLDAGQAERSPPDVVHVVVDVRGPTVLCDDDAGGYAALFARGPHPATVFYVFLFLATMDDLPTRTRASVRASPTCRPRRARASPRRCRQASALWPCSLPCRDRSWNCAVCCTFRVSRAGPRRRLGRTAKRTRSQRLRTSPARSASTRSP